MTADTPAAGPSDSGAEETSAVHSELPSSAPDTSPPQAAESAPVEAADASAANQSAEGQAAESAKPRIKIGTQRPGVAVPRIEPRAKVAFRTPPTQRQPVDRPPSNEQFPAKPTADTARAKPHRETEEEGSVPAVPQRKTAPKKSKFEIPMLPVGKVETPNLRADLPPELEAELQAALGDQSLEELIASESGTGPGAVTGEPLELESRHSARVARIFRDNVFVDLGGRNQGVTTLHMLPAEPQIGDTLEVVVTKFNAEDGLYEVSPVGASVQVGDWSDIAEGITVEARITGHNKGGLECEVNKIRGFIPAGQISIYRVENFEEFVGQKLAVRGGGSQSRAAEFGAQPPRRFWSASRPRPKKNCCRNCKWARCAREWCATFAISARLSIWAASTGWFTSAR